MLSNRQRALISKQREEEESTDSFVTPAVRVRIGDRIEFLDHPEFSGVVTRISQDQWKLISVYYGVSGHAKIVSPHELNILVTTGRANLIPAEPKKTESTKV
jgi:hypothetical protein